MICGSLRIGCVVAAAIFGWSGLSVAQADSELDDIVAIAASKKAAVRNGPALVLRTKSKPTELVDGRCLATAEERHCLYRFVRYEADHRAFLVHAYYDDEFDTFLWVQETDGHIIFLPDEPHFSPDGHRFVVVRSCEAFGSFCGVQVWKSKGPEFIWERRPTEYAEYELVRWKTNQKISLTVIDHQLTTKPANLVEDRSGRWAIDGPPEKSE